MDDEQFDPDEIVVGANASVAVNRSTTVRPFRRQFDAGIFVH